LEVSTCIKRLGQASYEDLYDQICAAKSVSTICNSASSLARRINVPVEEARELMRAYFATYTGVDRWLRQAAQRVRKQGYVASLAASYWQKGQAERTKGAPQIFANCFGEQADPRFQR
jgi:predicted phage tail protein